MAKKSYKQKELEVIKFGKEGRIFIAGSRGCWTANFWIAHQGFCVATRETKDEARFYCKMLKIAFDRLLC